MSARLAAALVSLAVVAGALLAYFCAAVFGMALSGSAVVGSAVAACVAVLLFAVHRFWVTGTLEPGPARPGASSPALVPLLALSLVLCFVAGQSALVWLQGWVDSSAWEAHGREVAAAPAALLLLTALVLAPAGEEALVRGIVYPRMRMHLPVWASALGSAALFALIHANLMQIAATLLLGVLLALAYEATGRLLVPIALHMAFNVAATFLPAGVIVAISQLPAVVVAWALATVSLIAVGMLAASQEAPRQGAAA